jgi:hypothetical protein
MPIALARPCRILRRVAVSLTPTLRGHVAYAVNETVLAKREISRLWEDPAHHTKRLFNSSVTGSRVWVAVELMRWVDEALEDEREKFDGRERLTVAHGNRLILWATMNHPHMYDATVNDFQTHFTREHINELVVMAP